MILGVDPGRSGALAAITYHGELLWTEDMPNPLTGYALRHLLNDEPVGQAVVERVHAMPKQGVSSTFAFGMAFGGIVMALEALGYPVELVSPTVWKKHYSLGADKDQARLLAQRRWPTSSALFARKKDDGRAEAALIASWWADKQRWSRAS